MVLLLSRVCHHAPSGHVDTTTLLVDPDEGSALLIGKSPLAPFALDLSAA